VCGLFDFAPGAERPALLSNPSPHCSPTPKKPTPPASSPFYWLRIEGFDRLVAAIETGVCGDHAALAASLDQTYSQGELCERLHNAVAQWTRPTPVPPLAHTPNPNLPKNPRRPIAVLEVVLSAFDRQLVLAPTDQAAGTPQRQPLDGTVRSGSQQQQQQQQQQLPPGGLAPNQAPPAEWAAAARVLHGVCVLHAKTRAVLASAQYLQLLVNRACACPPAAPPGLDALLAVVASSGEAQALFVGNGGLQAVAHLARGRAAQPGVRAGGGGRPGVGAAAVSREVQLRCLGFIHVFMVHILSKAVRSGLVHANTQWSSQQLLHAEFGQAAAEMLCRPPPDESVLTPTAATAATSHTPAPSAAARRAAAGSGAAAAGGTADEAASNGSGSGGSSGGGADRESAGGGGGSGGVKPSVGSRLDALSEAALAAMARSSRVSLGQ